MENSGRTLRSRLVVPAEKSPVKGSKESRKKAGPKDNSKSGGGTRNGGGKVAKPSKLAEAARQAKEYLEGESEEEFVRNMGRKRARSKEAEGEMLSTAEVAEANRMALEAMTTDKYALESETRLLKIAEDISRYQSKATLANELLKGPQLTKKLVDINKKLDSLHQLQKVVKGYTMTRQDELFTGALKIIMSERHANKKRRVTPEDSEAEELEVSDGQYPFPKNFALFSVSIPSPSLDDRLHPGDRSTRSYRCTCVPFYPQAAICCLCATFGNATQTPQATDSGRKSSHLSQPSCIVYTQPSCVYPLAAILPGIGWVLSSSDTHAPLPCHFRLPGHILRVL
jgi:hypothetical protein